MIKRMITWSWTRALVVVTLSSFANLSAAPEIIDCHVHLWSLDRPAGIKWLKNDDAVLYRNFLPPNFETVAKENGVTGVVLVQAGQSLPDNQWNLDVTAHNKTLFRGLVGNLSEVIGSDEFAPLFISLCKDSRYLGYRLSGRYQKELNDAFFRDLEITAKAGKSVDFLAGEYSLKDIASIAQRLPQLRIILNHFGNVQLDGKALDPAWVADFRNAAKCPNVYCKVSALFGRVQQQPAPKDLKFYQPILDLAFTNFGDDRLIFGSDYPVTQRAGDYASVLTLTRSYFDQKGPDVTEKLFRKNAEKFYAIPEIK
jgi:L-fuconolactonase